MEKLTRNSELADTNWAQRATCRHVSRCLLYLFGGGRIQLGAWKGSLSPTRRRLGIEGATLAGVQHLPARMARVASLLGLPAAVLDRSALARRIDPIFG
jgi:hypothetical protein